MLTPDERKSLLFDVKEAVKEVIKEEVKEHYVAKTKCGSDRGNFALKIQSLNNKFIVLCIVCGITLAGIGGYKLTMLTMKFIQNV